MTKCTKVLFVTAGSAMINTTPMMKQLRFHTLGTKKALVLKEDDIHIHE
jgi:hypothetical protein